MKLSEIKLLFYYLFKNLDSKGLIIDIKKVLVVFLILGIIVLIVTNPTEFEHKFYIKNELDKFSKSNNDDKMLFNSLETNVLDSIYSEVIDKEISYQNYFIYSNTKNRRSNWELSTGYGEKIEVHGSVYDLFQIAKEICIKVRASKEFIIQPKKPIGYPISIGNIEVAQYDFPTKMNWNDALQAAANLGDGWRLPTMRELNILRNNKFTIGEFVDNIYWSNEYDYSGYAYCLDFSRGMKSPANKGNLFYVRVVKPHY